jgi:hypothetical protein
VTYKNISKESTPITTTISLTWYDIINHTTEDKNIWFTLRNAVCDEDSVIEDYKKNHKKFGKYVYGDENFFFDIKKKTTSLGILDWPVEDGGLLLTDETEFKNIINNPSYNKNGITNYANTSDPSTFGKDKNKEDIKNTIAGQFAPFGTLRMHNFLDKDNDKSGYYCDVDILRCKNFYMIQ